MAEANKRPTRPKMPNKGNNPLMNKNNPKKFNVFWVYGIIMLLILALYFNSSGAGPKRTNWRTFVDTMLIDNDIEKIVIVNGEKAMITIKKEKLANPEKRIYKSFQNTNKFMPSSPTVGPHFYLDIGSEEVFRDDLAKALEDYPEVDRITPDHEIKQYVFKELMGWLLFPLILIVAWIFILRRMSGGVGGGGGAGGIFNVGKSKAVLFDKEGNIKTNFKDVAGLEEAKTEVMEIVDFLKNPKKYTELGGKIPKGALLVGPPGTGKTLLAKAVAGEANVPFFSMSGSDFVEMFVGVGASRVRDLFKQAKEKSPCIVFIDEIDAIGRARGKNPNMGANDERENTLNQLLTEMDGFATNSGVIILAATNRADILDRALMRAGRFDRQIHVELPDLTEREAIFNVHLKPLKLQKGFDISFLAKQTPGFSGADIANVCNEAALIAARSNKKAIEKQDFLDAVDRIIGGLEKKNKIITMEEKRTIAFHEAGHAAISWLCEHSNPLVKVTIIPRGRALGAAWYLPEERQLSSREQMLDEMVSTLGGRAAEEITFGKITTGALNDLERVTKQAYNMVSFFGMSESVGNLSFYDSSGQREYSFQKPYSEKTSELIDEEVKKLVEEQYIRAKKILSDNKEGLEKLANLLLENEVIFGEDLEKIFGKRPWKTREELLAEMEVKTPKPAAKKANPTNKTTTAKNKVEKKPTTTTKSKAATTAKKTTPKKTTTKPKSTDNKEDK